MPAAGPERGNVAAAPLERAEIAREPSNFESLLSQDAHPPDLFGPGENLWNIDPLAGVRFEAPPRWAVPGDPITALRLEWA
jgi:hypothetical protein